MQDASITRADFDRIARLAQADEPCEYQHVLLGALPRPCESALEIGCGTGHFARQLAERATWVTAVDLSSEMIRAARQRTQAHNLAYRVADVTAWDWPAELFDCVVSIATLHHLPFEETLAGAAAALRPGGTLIVHDLFESRGFLDVLRSTLAVGVRALRHLMRPRPRPSLAVRAAWAAHGQHDQLMSFAEVKRRALAVLPGAVVRRHLLWRYTLIWRRPPQAT